MGKFLTKVLKLEGYIIAIWVGVAAIGCASGWLIAEAYVILADYIVM